MLSPEASPMTEFILGGQRSGKSRRAEALAGEWLAGAAHRQAVLIATAQPWDEEMRRRIARHRADRMRRVPAMTTVEEPLELATAIARCSAAQTLIVVDCLTLWLTNVLMPAPRNGRLQPISPHHASVASVCDRRAALLAAVKNAAGPVVLVGNEIGLGVVPMGAETRAFVDALGQLNQAVAGVCSRVTFMAAGLPLVLKGLP